MQIEEKRIAVFFYGSFMRSDVMARGGFYPAHIEVAKLSGFDIRIDPHANIIRSDQHCIYGILVNATHKELNSLYAMDGVGVFLPEAVNVELQNGSLQAALCYIPPARVSKPADIAYLERLITTAQEYEFPAWYVQRLKNLL
jgi:Gamma-glutamyl cyclotransferase, AIG2-like